MELGKKLKQARLEAGLSQRQLCADTITRNMLSQIENGTAKPSFATLKALSARLGKPISYFQENAPSENLAVLHKAMQHDAATAMDILQEYLPDDPVLDIWYHFLLCKCCIDLAEQALSDDRIGLCRSFLEQAVQIQGEEPTITYIFGERLILLQYHAGMTDTVSAAAALPDNTPSTLLRAASALQQNNPSLCLTYIKSADQETDEGRLLQADAFLQLGDYAKAAECYLQLQNGSDRKIYAKLELCYKEMGDFQKAYEYACKQR